MALVGFATGADSSIDVPLVVITMAGGLALFLLGLEHLSSSLKLIAGDRMRTLLARLTTNRFAGLLTGAGVTAVIQSSSVTTVLVVGFISSGVMTLSQSIGVILGANVGTTVTAQVIAFDVTRYALALVAVGFAVGFYSRREARRLYGTLIMGLGLVFFGMVVMADAMDPLRESETFIDLLAAAKNPLVGLFVAAAFTAIVQSSSATTGVVIVLATQGLIGIEAGIVLILGANVGTAITALLAAIGKPRDALRAAVVHAIFNVLGAVLWIGLVDSLAWMVESIGGDTARQIANAHTIFNIANALIFIGLTDTLARLATIIVRDRADPAEALIAAKHLDTDLIATPSLALERARFEVTRMANRTRRMVRDILPAVLEGPGTRLREIESEDDKVDALHGQIIKYLGRVSERQMSEGTTAEFVALMEATNAIEAIGDIIETNLVREGLHRIDEQITVSDETAERIRRLHEAVAESYDLAIKALKKLDRDMAIEVRNRKDLIEHLEAEVLERQVERLGADEPKRGRTFRFEIDVVNDLKRIHYFARRIARAVLPIEEQATEGRST